MEHGRQHLGWRRQPRRGAKERREGGARIQGNGGSLHASAGGDVCAKVSDIIDRRCGSLTLRDAIPVDCCLRGCISCLRHVVRLALLGGDARRGGNGCFVRSGLVGIGLVRRGIEPPRAADGLGDGLKAARMLLREDENQGRQYLRLDPARVRVQQGRDDILCLSVSADAFALDTTVVSYHITEETRHS